jgi:hypothetical protein
MREVRSDLSASARACWTKEAFIRWLAETWVEGSEVFRWRVVKGLPAAGVFEM